LLDSSNELLEIDPRKVLLLDSSKVLFSVYLFYFNSLKNVFLIFCTMALFWRFIPLYVYYQKSSSSFTYIFNGLHVLSYEQNFFVFLQNHIQKWSITYERHCFLVHAVCHCQEKTENNIHIKLKILKFDITYRSQMKPLLLLYPLRSH
jgi:hypothetical protein